ncbi:MAG: hypothetical protein JSW58_17070 [Candidatus Latescibacterota bacterium]|nr:MAG: hypothetical protein JSW58_17070 [Candidatus Latescibacterota bacterium]
MEYIAIILFALAAIMFVTYPLFGRRRRFYEFEDVFDLGDIKQLDFLNSKKASINNNLRELDFEYEMGKLSEHDYTTLRAGYESEVESVEKAMDKLKIKKEIQELIESEVRSRRRIK